MMTQSRFYSLLHDVYNILSLHRYIGATTPKLLPLKKDFLWRNTTVVRDCMPQNFFRFMNTYFYPTKHGCICLNIQYFDRKNNSKTQIKEFSHRSFQLHEFTNFISFPTNIIIIEMIYSFFLAFFFRDEMG